MLRIGADQEVTGPFQVRAKARQLGGQKRLPRPDDEHHRRVAGDLAAQPLGEPQPLDAVVEVLEEALQLAQAGAIRLLVRLALGPVALTVAGCQVGYALFSGQTQERLVDLAVERLERVLGSTQLETGTQGLLRVA